MLLFLFLPSSESDGRLYLEYADDFYKPFLLAISARIQKQNVNF